MMPRETRNPILINQLSWLISGRVWSHPPHQKEERVQGGERTYFNQLWLACFREGGLVHPPAFEERLKKTELIRTCIRRIAFGPNWRSGQIPERQELTKSPPRTG